MRLPQMELLRRPSLSHPSRERIDTTSREGVPEETLRFRMRGWLGGIVLAALSALAIKQLGGASWMSVSRDVVVVSRGFGLS